MRVARFLLVALVALLSIRCGRVGSEGRVGREDRYRSQSAYVADTDPQTWSERAVVEIENRDTISCREISIFIKHQPKLNQESVRVRIYTSSPDCTIHFDDVTIPLDDRSKGRRISSKISHFLYRGDVVWSQQGVYNIDIFPLEPIVGVEAVGVEVRTLNKKFLSN